MPMDQQNIEADVQRVFDDFRHERNVVPEYAQVLAREAPEFLGKWFDTQRTFRGRGVLPEKDKELLLMACNAIRLGLVGVRTHMRTALDMGTTQEESFEAAQTKWFIGGGPPLNMCVRAR
ncbi:MAG: carboxymuconolactone decarboxylase family protein [Gemmatimonadales bacterium]|nr:carboxymuconolactone decarboxylase family protein [Gemmatimonadales bacterium]